MYRSSFLWSGLVLALCQHTKDFLDRFRWFYASTAKDWCKARLALSKPHLKNNFLSLQSIEIYSANTSGKMSTTMSPEVKFIFCSDKRMFFKSKISTRRFITARNLMIFIEEVWPNLKWSAVRHRLRFLHHYDAPWFLTKPKTATTSCIYGGAAWFKMDLSSVSLVFTSVK